MINNLWGDRRRPLNTQKISESLKKEEVKLDEKQQLLPSSKKESMLSNLMQSVRSLKSEKKKSNPLMIDQDLEQDERASFTPSAQTQIVQQASQLVPNLPPELKQEVIPAVMTRQQSKAEDHNQQIKSKVKVQIIDAVIKGGTLSKYYLYTIKGEDMHGGFFIKRKYAEFLSLRKIITQRWPGLFVPALKNKIQMHNLNQKERLITLILTNFLSALSYFQHIYYKEQVQLFLRCPDIDFCEMFDHMPELKLSDLISRFQYAFGEQIKEIQGSKSMQMLSKFPQTLRKMISKLQIITSNVLDLAESYDNYVKNMQKFGETMRLYEYFSLSEFTQNNREMTVFVQDDDKKVDRMNKIACENVYYELFALFFIETNNARVFQETLIAIDLYALRREELEKQILQNSKIKQQIEAGNLTIKAMTTLKQKQEVFKNIQEKLKTLTQEKQHVLEIYKLIQKATVKHILPTFKKIKKNNYCLALSKLADVVGKQVPQLQQVWSFIKDLSSENIEKVSINKV